MLTGLAWSWVCYWGKSIRSHKHAASNDTHFAVRWGSPLHPSAEPVCCAEQHGLCSLHCQAIHPVPSQASNAGGHCAGLVFPELLVLLQIELTSGAYAAEAILIPACLCKSIEKMQCFQSCTHAGARSFLCGAWTFLAGCTLTCSSLCEWHIKLALKGKEAVALRCFEDKCFLTVLTLQETPLGGPFPSYSTIL